MKQQSPSARSILALWFQDSTYDRICDVTGDRVPSQVLHGLGTSPVLATEYEDTMHHVFFNNPADDIGHAVFFGSSEHVL